jgi:hypothetical protein
MKVHFVANANGDQVQYRKIVKILNDLNHELVTDHYLVRTIDQIKTESKQESKNFYASSARWIKNADVVIFETTRSDVSIGYEMSLVFQYQKPLIVLFSKDGGDEPFALKGNDSDLIQVYDYDVNDLSNLKEILEGALDFANSKKEIRFNLLLSSELNDFLNNVSKNQKLAKSQIVRNLIRQYKSELEGFNS